MQSTKKRNKKAKVKAHNSVLQQFTSHLELSAEATDCSPASFRAIKAGLKSGLQQDCYTIRMDYDTTCTTDGGGVFAVTYADNPSGDSNWSSAAAFFDEYRVLVTQVKFSPNVTSGGSLFVYAPIITVTDYDSSSALTGYTLASQYSSVVEHGGNKPWTHTAYMSGTADGGFTSTASPAAKYWVKTYTSGNSVSSVLGRIHIVHWVQFRGKGI